MKDFVPGILFMLQFLALLKRIIFPDIFKPKYHLPYQSTAELLISVLNEYPGMEFLLMDARIKTGNTIDVLGITFFFFFFFFLSTGE